MATQIIEDERVQVLKDVSAETSDGTPAGSYVLYWMQQSQRAEHNPALEHTVRWANQLGLPVVVGFGLTDDYPEANLRHYRFMLEGLSKTAAALERRGMRFVMAHGDPDEVALALARDAAVLVCDRGYLRHQKRWRERVAQEAPCRVEQVEGDVIVPVETVSGKREYAARTLRPKIHEHLDRFLEELATTAVDVEAGGGELDRVLTPGGEGLRPAGGADADSPDRGSGSGDPDVNAPDTSDPASGSSGSGPDDPDEAEGPGTGDEPASADRDGGVAGGSGSGGAGTLPLLDPSDVDGTLERLDLDRSVPPVTHFHEGGTAQARARLRRFVDERLERYDENSNQPHTDDVSMLSPYLHFGQISPVYVALEVLGHSSPDACGAFIEQLAVRRELAMNYCHFEPDYDRFEALPEWARETLAEHADDEREHLYTRDELDAAGTHDPYWNAAMREMKHTGFMHNYMRMYWGKKILEWSPSPEEAFERALYLNNRYFLDGRDPASFANVAWLFGLHDRAWAERDVFGKVRYMNANGLRRKTDPEAYVEKVEGLVEEAERAGVSFEEG